jgi:tetratricopeptide (TPR) repeat protein
MADYPFDLGIYRRAVTTGSSEAQTWFDRGLNWAFGYNHEEAVRCYRRATEADPSCAMAWWGIAYSAGPHYNMPWWLMDAAGQAASLEVAHDATRRATELIETVNAAERALIEALQARYPQVTPTDDMRPWNDDFANTMRRAYRALPEDLDIACIFVEAMMNRTPWKMWDLAAGAPADGADALECRSVLEKAFERADAWTHPGLLHLYVHLMEMSPTPEVALRMGDVLRTLVPDAGHLIHMATHIDVLCGHYENVVHWSRAAIVPDVKFFEREGAANIYTGYRQHNYHFVIYGAMFLGQIAPALEAVKGLRDTTPEEVLRIPSPPMADFFESYLSFEPHILVRFGRWRDCTELPLPEDQELYCTLTAFVWYARALGHAALGEIEMAERAEAEFQAARGRVPETRLLHNNTVVDLLAIADAMLTGEILYRTGDVEAGFEHLRRSVTLEDTLPYDEPWGWMQPARHALGALLFEQGRLAEAEAVYREDLGLGGNMRRATVHPDNVWALKGLHDCLAARGENVEIVQVKQRLDLAQARTDTPIRASCGCAQAAMAAE